MAAAPKPAAAPEPLAPAPILTSLSIEQDPGTPHFTLHLFLIQGTKLLSREKVMGPDTLWNILDRYKVESVARVFPAGS